MDTALAEAWRLVQVCFSNTRGNDIPVDLSLSGYVGAVYCVGLFVITWVVRLALIEPVASVLLSRHLKTTNSAKSKRFLKLKVQKFAQSTSEMLTYGLFTVIGIHVLRGEPWLWPSTQWWTTCGDNPKELGFCCWKVDWFGSELDWGGNDLNLPCRHRDIPPINETVLCYYLLYGARYVQAIVSVLLEHRRKDFVEMIVHHITTIALIGLSFSVGYIRVGAIIMLIFDPADVPLHTAKQFKYLGMETVRCLADTIIESCWF